MNQRVGCPGCGRPQSRRGVGGHLGPCGRMVELLNGFDGGRGVGILRGDAGCGGSVSVSGTRRWCVVQYPPTGVGTVLMSVMHETVRALLEQHNCYDVSQLTAYLRMYYPEIPENARTPIVVAAAAAARRQRSFIICGGIFMIRRMDTKGTMLLELPVRCHFGLRVFDLLVVLAARMSIRSR